MTTKSACAELWQRLQKVSQLKFEASTQTDSKWEGVGNGIVDVASPSSSELVYRESGKWSQNNGPAFGFSNVYRWTLLPSDCVRLEHLRFGDENPVFLFDLQSARQDLWQEIAPHQCSEDCYSATLKLLADVVQLEWTVRGATKNETIRYHYW